jgi:hypothetical protein
MEMFPERVELNKDVIRMSLVNQATFDLKPNKENAELFIAKEHIANWDELLRTVNERETLSIKEALHQAVEPYDKRPFRTYIAHRDTTNGVLEFSLTDERWDKSNELKKIIMDSKGLHLNYKVIVPYDLYKAFDMSFYEYPMRPS